MDEQYTVGYYGVHFHGDTPYLHQSKDGKGTDAFGGGSVSPFQVSQRLLPPHAIHLGSVGAAPLLPAGFLNNPLVDMYLPKPVLEAGQAKIAVIREDDGLGAYPLLRKLAELGSVSDESVRLWHPRSEGKAEADLRLTNLVPLTLLGWSPPETNALNTITAIAAAQRRKLVLVVEKYVPIPRFAVDLTDAWIPVRELLPTLDSATLRAVGSLVFQNYLKKLTETMYGTAPERAPNR